jgi:hypothetical protein
VFSPFDIACETSVSQAAERPLRGEITSDGCA